MLRAAIINHGQVTGEFLQYYMKLRPEKWKKPLLVDFTKSVDESNNLDRLNFDSKLFKENYNYSLSVLSKLNSVNAIFLCSRHKPVLNLTAPFVANSTTEVSHLLEIAQQTNTRHIGVDERYNSHLLYYFPGIYKRMKFKDYVTKDLKFDSISYFQSYYRWIGIADALSSLFYFNEKAVENLFYFNDNASKAMLFDAENKILNSRRRSNQPFVANFHAQDCLVMGEHLFSYFDPKSVSTTAPQSVEKLPPS